MSALNSEPRNAAITNVASILFKKVGAIQAARTKILLKLEEYIQSYITECNYTMCSSKILTSSLMATSVHVLTIIQVQKEIKKGEQPLHVVWEKYTPEITQIYYHVLKKFSIILAFGSDTIYQCIEQLIYPMQIVYLQKNSGEFIQRMEDIQNQSSIRVGCKLFLPTATHIQPNSKPELPTISVSKFASPKNRLAKDGAYIRLVQVPTTPIHTKQTQLYRKLSWAEYIKKPDTVHLSPLTFGSPRSLGHCPFLNLCFSPKSSITSQRCVGTPTVKQFAFHL
jgi:hypothetical protein